MRSTTLHALSLLSLIFNSMATILSVALHNKLMFVVSLLFVLIAASTAMNVLDKEIANAKKDPQDSNFI